MKIYDIINELEKLIRETDSNASLVLHRNIQEHPVIKIMKRFNYTLYLVKNKEKTRLLEETFVDKCPAGELDDKWEKHDILFIFYILKWMDTEDYKKLRNEVK